MWYFYDGTDWWMIFGWVWMVIFWGGLIALIIWGIRKLTGRGYAAQKHGRLDVAKERYHHISIKFHLGTNEV